MCAGYIKDLMDASQLRLDVRIIQVETVEEGREITLAQELIEYGGQKRFLRFLATKHHITRL